MVRPPVLNSFPIPEIKSHTDQSDAVCSQVCSWVHLAQPLQLLPVIICSAASCKGHQHLGPHQLSHGFLSTAGL